MSSQSPTNSQGVVLVNQIINGSLIFGLAMFLGIVIVLSHDRQATEPQITYVALGFMAIGAFVYFVFQSPIDRHRAKQVMQDRSFDRVSDELFMALAPSYQIERIMKLAMIEGAGFFNGVVYLLEKSGWSLAAMGIAILLMLVGFPTRSQIDAWIERRTVGLQFGDSET